jgi:pilus assembly protein CpaC
MNRVITAVVVTILCVGSTMTAQQPQRLATPLASSSITLTAGRGELLQFTDETSRVSVSDPTIADAIVVSAHDVVVNGKAPGNTTIMIWHGDNVSPYAVTVEPDLTEIQKQLRATFPAEHIDVSSSKDAILLTGVVSEPEIAKQAAAIAAVHAKSVVNLLQSPTAENRQVMLHVKFASVDRTSLATLGANIFSVNPKMVGSLTTQQFNFPRTGQLQFSQGANGPQLGNQTVTVSDLLNLFAFSPDLNIGATLAMLQNQNLLQILAEPNLVTVSGHEASFLAGGEFPFPVITNTGTGGQAAPVVTIQFRKFGVQLNFTPTVAENGLIHLKVKPEVSSLDFSNALTIQGFTIPAISSRTAETEVDLHEGESFAIAGLIDNRVTKQISKIAGIGDLPVIGNLFKTRSTDKANTELLVVITPSFVKPFASGTSPAMPTFPEGFLGDHPGQSGRPTFLGPRGNDVSGGKP